MLTYYVNGKESTIFGTTSYLGALIDTFSESWDSWRLCTKNGTLLATKS
jgi:hypothetical protein